MTKYPLAWPTGWRRTAAQMRVRAKYEEFLAVTAAYEQAQRELGFM